MSAYLRSLHHAVRQETRDTAHTGNDVHDLMARVQRWFDALPEFTRQRPFSICEMELALGKPGRLISPALLVLGWTRKRRWDSRGHYHRYWMPPDMNS